MNSRDFISFNDVAFEILQTVDDVKLKKGLAKGWYIQQAKNAIEELSFDTFFDERTMVLDVPKDLQLDMPKDMFNIREMYLFNGANCCVPETSALVHWKRLFNNKPQGGETGKRVEFSKRGNRDPFYAESLFDFETVSDRIHYFNIQNGVIMFSSNSTGFTKVKIIYNGMGGEIDEAPIIPRFFRQAITYFVLVKFYEYQIGREPRRHGGTLTRHQLKLDREWEKAENRIKMMDTLEKDELNEYLSRPNIG